MKQSGESTCVQVVPPLLKFCGKRQIARDIEFVNNDTHQPMRIVFKNGSENAFGAAPKCFLLTVKGSGASSKRMLTLNTGLGIFERPGGCYSATNSGKPHRIEIEFNVEDATKCTGDVFDCDDTTCERLVKCELGGDPDIMVEC
jgi:hypothetical protein